MSLTNPSFTTAAPDAGAPSSRRWWALVTVALARLFVVLGSPGGSPAPARAPGAPATEWRPATGAPHLCLPGLHPPSVRTGRAGPSQRRRQANGGEGPPAPR